MIGNTIYCTNCSEQVAGRDGLTWINKPYVLAKAGKLKLVEMKNRRWSYLNAHADPQADVYFCSGECLWENFDKQKYLKEQYHQVYKATESDRKHLGVVARLKNWLR